MSDLNRTSRLFKTYDALDYCEFLSNVDSPRVFILVEDKPSTMYYLPGYVIESLSTGEWFVFNRGRFALEGDSGLRQMEDFLSYLKNHKIVFSAWVLEQGVLNNIEAGVQLWPDVKNKLIPLRSYHSDDVMWDARKRVVSKFK
ncbi:MULTISPECIES: hypothetical protein [Pectobacterium]|uniref:hypothetical protein n=1 Tax=Pectobacterium TaxID=122277 RepID=UPI000D60C0ED|nr:MULTISPECIES: hypothetical protein [Pectobacterium]MBA0190685.1 hypothetical protein [Pectobacterium odoriferum]PWD69468.1 hypothetical protein DF215_12385 [Pectobacterium versatile]